jgi:GT2 family glycosyltransferase
VIVSDDASIDDSISWIEKNFPAVKIVRNKINRGFSATANAGIHAATYELVFLMNSDVKLEPGYFLPQLKYFDRPDTFGVMGRIIGWDDDQIQDGAKYPSFHQAKIKTSKNYLLSSEEEMKEGIYTSYISGANALLNKNHFLRLGGFNELFSPFYVEDFELSLRAWRTGLKCYYEHQSVCRHKTSTTIKSKSRKSFIRMISNRNKWYAHAIHLSAGRRFLWMIQLIPEILFQTILLKTYYLKAFGQYLKNLDRIKSSREELKKINEGKKLLSVQEVAVFIQQSVKDKDIRFF